MGNLADLLRTVYTKVRYASKLEGATSLAAKGQMGQEAFAKILLASEVYVLVQDVSAQKKNIILVAELNGTRIIPVFSSVEKIKLFVKQRYRYTAIKGQELFSLIQDTEPVVLNPGDKYSKTFSIEEVAELANRQSK